MALRLLRNIFLVIYFPIVFFLWATTGFLWGLLSPPLRYKLHKISRHWSRFAILPMMGASLDIKTREVPRSGAWIYMSNHQSYLDIVLLLGYLPGFFSFIAKKELFYIPFLGWYIVGAGHIFIEREDSSRAHGALKKALKRLKVGENIMVFPEGTRSDNGELLPFKRGSFILALQSGVPIIPVRIRGTGAVLPRGTLFPRPGRISMRMGDPIPTQGLLGSKKEQEQQLMASVRKTMESL